MLFIILLYIAKVPLENFSGINIYPIVTFLLLFVILKNLLKSTPSQDLFFYIFILITSICISSITMQNIAGNFINMVFILILQPVAVMLLITEGKYRYTTSLNWLKWISYISCISIVGAIYFYLVHTYGFPDPYEIFAIEFTRAGDAVVLRNPSFYGVSLILCGVSLITFLSSAYLHYELGKSKFFILEIVSVLCIFLSLSRRGLLPIIIFYIFLFLVKLNARAKTKFFIIFSLILGIFYVTQPTLFGIAYDRIVSIFDLSGDQSNISRITLIAEGVATIHSNPLGTGLGTLSAIGYTVEDVKSLDNVQVTESTIITIIGELGLVGSALIALLLAKKISSFRIKSQVLYILPLVVESIVGLGFLNPFTSALTLIFLACTYILERSK